MITVKAMLESSSMYTKIMHFCVFMFLLCSKGITFKILSIEHIVILKQLLHVIPPGALLFEKRKIISNSEQSIM